MRPGFLCIIAAAILAIAASAAEDNSTAHHPDLSGVWSYGIDLPPVALKEVVNGKTVIKTVDQSARHGEFDSVSGALPSTPAPSYKAELQAKVKYLAQNESKVDTVFYCGKPGVPRIGSPRKIVQLPKEVVFFYEDISGDPYRIIPTDGRPHRQDGNPSAYGDSVAHWEGDTLVVDVTNFADYTWFGEEGYFHSPAMHVTERLWKNGENLVWQATVDDPGVLTAPWTMAARVIRPSNDPLEESPRCVEDDGKRLLNLDHHQQR